MVERERRVFATYPQIFSILQALKHDTDLCKIICNTPSNNEGNKEVMVADPAL